MNLNERILDETQILENDPKKLPSGILARIRRTICVIDEKNANKRIYGRKVWDNVLNDPEFQSKLKARQILGEHEHPAESSIKLDKDRTSHVISNMFIDESTNEVKADFDILPTDSGKFIWILHEAGVKVPASTRADGELSEEVDESGEKYSRVIPDSYKFITVDHTGDPSCSKTEPEDIVKAVRTNYESHAINKNVAIALLEKAGSKKALKLKEDISIDKQHKECKCKLGEKKCSGGCEHANEVEVKESRRYDELVDMITNPNYINRPALSVIEDEIEKAENDGQISKLESGELWKLKNKIEVKEDYQNDDNKIAHGKVCSKCGARVTQGDDKSSCCDAAIVDEAIKDDIQKINNDTEKIKTITKDLKDELKELDEGIYDDIEAVVKDMVIDGNTDEEIVKVIGEKYPENNVLLLKELLPKVIARTREELKESLDESCKMFCPDCGWNGDIFAVSVDQNDRMICPACKSNKVKWIGAKVSNEAKTNETTFKELRNKHIIHMKADGNKVIVELDSDDSAQDFMVVTEAKVEEASLVLTDKEAWQISVIAGRVGGNNFGSVSAECQSQLGWPEDKANVAAANWWKGKYSKQADLFWANNKNKMSKHYPDSLMKESKVVEGKKVPADILDYINSGSDDPELAKKYADKRGISPAEFKKLVDKTEAELENEFGGPGEKKDITESADLSKLSNEEILTRYKSMASDDHQELNKEVDALMKEIQRRGLEAEIMKIGESLILNQAYIKIVGLTEDFKDLTDEQKKQTVLSRSWSIVQRGALPIGTWVYNTGSAKLEYYDGKKDLIELGYKKEDKYLIGGYIIFMPENYVFVAIDSNVFTTDYQGQISEITDSLEKKMGKKIDIVIDLRQEKIIECSTMVWEYKESLKRAETYMNEKKNEAAITTPETVKQDIIDKQDIKDKKAEEYKEKREDGKGEIKTVNTTVEAKEANEESDKKDKEEMQRIMKENPAFFKELLRVGFNNESKTKVSEAILIAERDKAIELGTVLEKRVNEVSANYTHDVSDLSSKLRDVSAHLDAKTAELVKVSANFHKEHGELEESKKTIKELNEKLGDKSSALAKAEEIKSKLEKQLKNIEDQIKQLKESNEKQIRLLKESHAMGLVKTYTETKVKTMGLKLPDNVRTLFESCKSVSEVDKLIEMVQDMIRGNGLHFNPVTEINVGEPIEESVISKQIASAFRAMGQ